MNPLKPLQYLQNVIREDTPERVSALLAVGAGFALILGFLGVIGAIIFFGAKLATELVTVCGAMVALSTFNRVDAGSSVSRSTLTKSVGNTTTTIGQSQVATTGGQPPALPPPAKIPVAGVGSDE